mmetsp:Transcript_46111/g.90876  ORF Transcript_46111/g.90876 Transcript_46111/m.90876 type:complete len:97 (+) Transcript_46111:719-1009(+)
MGVSVSLFVLLDVHPEGVGGWVDESVDSECPSCVCVKYLAMHFSMLGPALTTACRVCDKVVQSRGMRIQLSMCAGQMMFPGVLILSQTFLCSRMGS